MKIPPRQNAVGVKLCFLYLSRVEQVAEAVQEQQMQSLAGIIQIQREDIAYASYVIDNIVAVHMQQVGGFGELAVKAEEDEESAVIICLMVYIVTADLIQNSQLTLLTVQKHINMIVRKAEYAAVDLIGIQHILGPGGC